MRQWQAPGAGLWKRDDGHITQVMSKYLEAVLMPSKERGFAEGFASVGALIEGFDAYEIAGRHYERPRIVGAPKLPIWGDTPPAKVPAPGKPPPKLVFRILFAVHPELRKRARNAAALWKTRAWRELARRWNEELREPAIAKNRALQGVAITALDDPALADHLAEVTEALREGFVQHFRHAAMYGIVVGDFLVRARGWTKLSTEKLLPLLRGASPASRAGADEASSIAKAVKSDLRARELIASNKPAAEIVAALRAWPGDIGRALGSYLDDHGLRLVTGLDLHNQSLLEMPELIVRAVAAALAEQERPRADPDAIGALRASVPSQHHAELDAALEETRFSWAVRDDDAGILGLWRLGLVRRALFEAGTRLVAAGKIHAPHHLHDARPDEVVRLLRGEPAPTGDELRLRAEHRAELDALDPPVALGQAGPLPDPSCFPAAVARNFVAVQTFMKSFEGTNEAAATGVRGTGANGGTYEGRACVVRGPEDFAQIEAGDVLIARHTSPAFNVLLPLLGAIVTERGGVLSHAAIVAREYGIPAVVDSRNAIARIPNGSRVRVDGDTGVVEVIGEAVLPRRKAKAPVPDSKPVIPDEPATAGCLAVLRDASAIEFGGKGRALASAVKAGLPVPDGRALDADLVDRIVRGEPDAIERVSAACAGLPGGWAVRSSAVGEDSAQASFAGQHATVLGVQPGELLVAIAAVHASGHTASALAYRKRMGVVGPPRMGVVVQTLLRPDCSGVMFSRDPTARPVGDEAKVSRLIEATWGLGEALVAGLVTPDRYRVAVNGEVLERVIGDKDIAIAARAEGGTAEISIGADRARTACLDDARLAELVTLARRCEQLFGGPQDLEWAVANGKLYLLQSRPVTTSVRSATTAPSVGGSSLTPEMPAT